MLSCAVTAMILVLLVLPASEVFPPQISFPTTFSISGFDDRREFFGARSRDDRGKTLKSIDIRREVLYHERPSIVDLSDLLFGNRRHHKPYFRDLTYKGMHFQS